MRECKYTRCVLKCAGCAHGVLVMCFIEAVGVGECVFEARGGYVWVFLGWEVVRASGASGG